MTDKRVQRRDILKTVPMVALAGVGSHSATAATQRDRSGPAESTGTHSLGTDLEWRQMSKLVADDGDAGDVFGISVTVSGDGTTAIIGARRDEDPNGPASGSAYVFDKAGDTWTQQAKLAADDGDSQDGFGDTVAVSNDGTTAIIGAPGDDNFNGDGAGSAYVFNEGSGTWTQQAKLAADNGDTEDFFGISVAVSGNGRTAIIGARNDGDTEEDTELGGAGSAYVFSKSGDTWTQQAKLAADDGESYENFGWSVAVSDNGDTAIIGGADNEAYVFREAEGIWAQQARLAVDSRPDGFGDTVAVSNDGTTAIIGAPDDDNFNGDDAGSAYVFNEDSGTWTQQAKLAADDGDAGDFFAQSVAVSSDGDSAIIGAYDDQDPNGAGAGSAYVFSALEGSWTQETKLAAEDGKSEDNFGKSVAVSGDGTTAVIGAGGDDDPNGSASGSAYVFSGDEANNSPDTVTLPGNSNQAADPDDDGLYEDVNGDGEQNLFDALDYYNARDSSAVQNNPDLFNFDGKGEPGTLFDALELFNEIS